MLCASSHQTLCKLQVPERVTLRNTGMLTDSLARERLRGERKVC